MQRAFDIHPCLAYILRVLHRTLAHPVVIGASAVVSESALHILIQ